MEESNFNKCARARAAHEAYYVFFASRLKNSFEPLADKEIERLKKEIDELNKKHDNQVDSYDGLLDIEYIKEQIWALIEMKIICAFKFLEINAKQLIGISFPDTDTKGFYQWDPLNSFLKSKNIQPSTLDGYKEVEQLREVNNSLKHSDEFSEKEKGILEVKVEDDVTYDELDSFYSRVKAAPKTYLEHLSSAIHTELYDFNSKKINKLADDIASRMEKNDADLLITAIKSRY